MWPILTGIILAAAVALHLRWRRGFRELRRQMEDQERSVAAQREQQERSVAQIEAQQEAVFNSMMEGVLVLDRSERILLVNQSLQRLFAVDHDVRGRTITEAFRFPELAELVQ